MIKNLTFRPQMICDFNQQFELAGGKELKVNWTATQNLLCHHELKMNKGLWIGLAKSLYWILWQI